MLEVTSQVKSKPSPRRNDVKAHRSAWLELAWPRSAHHWQVADINNTQSLDFDEFCAMMLERSKELSPSELRAFFDELDENHDGQ